MAVSQSRENDGRQAASTRAARADPTATDKEDEKSIVEVARDRLVGKRDATAWPFDDVGLGKEIVLLERQIHPGHELTRMLPGCEANRRMRTRVSGGVGGAGVSPAPTRLSRPPRYAHVVVNHLVVGEFGLVLSA
jgi:hypothetical protein